MSRETPVSPRRSPAPVVISLLLAGVLIVALGYWVGKRQAAGPADTASPPGTLGILRPLAGDSVGAEVRLVFRTDAPLELTPRGWLAGSWHPHAMVDGQPRMAASSDIRRLGAGRFAWTLRLAPGDHRVRLVWATLQHRTVEAGASAARVLHVRDGAGAVSLPRP